MKPYDSYSSKTRKINIPVPSFDDEEDYQNDGCGLIIGRDRITEKLREWLSGKKKGGSFLVTGYRGVGKTRFVNRVLYELSATPSIYTNALALILLAAIVTSIIHCFPCNTFTCIAVISSILVLAILIILHCWYPVKEWIRKIKFWYGVYIKHDNATRTTHLWNYLHGWYEFYKNIRPKEWDRISNQLYDARAQYKRYTNISIKVNLGQEILDERSVLCVVSSQLYARYKSFVLSPVSNIWLFLISAIGSTLIYTSNHIVINIPFLFWMHDLPINFCIIVFFIFCVFSYQLIILSNLRQLSKRINASLTESYNVGGARESINVGYGENYNYPIAVTRDIEAQLISILEKINRFPFNPKFIFVFDELDKIESPHNETNHSNEFIGEKYHPGGGTSQKRLGTVMHLLANMKFFTSTAKAKFVFIAGRELYDGYLADLSDRESAISSIFDGVIYVESFCKNEKLDKDVMYNTESFIARQLIPKKYIKELVYKEFLKTKNGNTLYRIIDINLKTYYEYLITSYQKALSEKSGNKKKDLPHDVREMIDAVIMTLYHYSVYLYHISNGSPKKMNMSFKELLRPLKDKSEFILSKRNCKETFEIDIKIPSKSQYLLSFDENTQRVIGFIHYITFPVTQILTDANQYGDKLLVSASYLVNHIYKNHSGGFSWRNIEQTPELLDVYKKPELRNFINNILAYLLKTHIVATPFAIYQYKFRKHISDEIAIASKFSEQISSLFNFTRDESMVVKNHYSHMQKLHNDELKDEQITSRHSMAGLHNIIGDLYMADEDYNNAITAYQTALSVINSKERNGVMQDNYYALYMLIMCKMGIAYEKRGTYAEAFSAYHTLTTTLTDYVKEYKEDGSALKVLTNSSVLFQPLLAKFYVVEKMSACGITKEHIEDLLYECRSLKRVVTCNLLFADFYQNIGDILYYKNIKITSSNKKIYTAEYFYDKGIDYLRSYISCSNDASFNLLKLLNSEGSIPSNILVQLGDMLARKGQEKLASSKIKQNCSRECAVDISTDFLINFLSDACISNRALGGSQDIERHFNPLSNNLSDVTLVEESILFFWESSVAYRMAGDSKKAFDSMKKILRVIQNYMRISENNRCICIKIKNKVIIGEFLNEIKNRIIKQCLICIYSHYEDINLVEIQRLKWIFHLHMYENISLNRLSLFPDVEEVMLIYYELILLCVVNESYEYDISDIQKAIQKSNQNAKFSWKNKTERNNDFIKRLKGIYRNTSLKEYRYNSTSYERILALRFKAEMNAYILHSVFPNLKKKENDSEKGENDILKILSEIEENPNNEWLTFFEEAEVSLSGHIGLLDFLIRDSLYCLTSIIESIVPNTTTLFTHSFIASIYRDLSKWNMLFDKMFLMLKSIDSSKQQSVLSNAKENGFQCTERSTCKYKEIIPNNNNSEYQKLWQSRCPNYSLQCDYKKNKYEKTLNSEVTNKISKACTQVFKSSDLASCFFGRVLNAISTNNSHYLLVNYSAEMAVQMFRKAKEMHTQGKAYKDMITQMYFLNGDLDNDTLMFDVAIERFKLNSDHLDDNIQEILASLTNSIYDVENFCVDNQTSLPLENRITD